MYFWNVKALAQDLREHKVSEYDKMRYFLVMTIALVLSSYLSVEQFSKLLLLELLLSLIISCVGVIACYRANKAGDNKQFIERFTCLGLPISVRFVVLFTLIYTIYMIGGYVMFGQRFDVFSEKYIIVDVFSIAIFEALFYNWMRSYILDVASTKEISNA